MTQYPYSLWIIFDVEGVPIEACETKEEVMRYKKFEDAIVEYVLK
ncbi:MAG: hypothetical protein ACRCST_04345 [Turicibacter sp.]